MLNTMRGSTLQGADVSTALDKNSCGHMLSDRVRRQVLGPLRPVAERRRPALAGSGGTSTRMTRTMSRPLCLGLPRRCSRGHSWKALPSGGRQYQGGAARLRRCNKRSLWRENVDEAASSSEAPTRLSADKDNEEEEDASNVSRLEGPKKMGHSPPWLRGHRLRHIHSCPKDSIELPLWKHCRHSHAARRGESHLLVEASLAALERLHNPQEGPNFARPQPGCHEVGFARRHAGRLQLAQASRTAVPTRGGAPPRALPTLDVGRLACLFGNVGRGVGAGPCEAHEADYGEVDCSASCAQEASLGLPMS